MAKDRPIKDKEKSSTMDVSIKHGDPRFASKPVKDNKRWNWVDRKWEEDGS